MWGGFIKDYNDLQSRNMMLETGMEVLQASPEEEKKRRIAAEKSLEKVRVECTKEASPP